MAYRLVIIDDNPIAVQSLSQCFDWEQLGIEIAGTALDGIQGKELILRTHPDIVITDINMPDIDGLSMIEQVYEHLTTSKIIVITGYDEFQYASRAIKLSVFDFILKPIDDAELQNSLKRVIKILDEEKIVNIQVKQMRENVRRAQLLSLLTASDAHDTSVKELVQKYGIEFASYFIIVAQSKNGISQPLLRRIDHESNLEGLKIITLIMNDTVVVFCMCDCDDQAWRKSAERMAARLLYLEPEFAIAVSSLQHHYHHIRAAYQEARWLLTESKLLDAYGYIRFYNDSEDIRSSKSTELKKKCQDLAHNINQSEALYQRVYKRLAEAANGDIEALRLMLLHYSTLKVHECLNEEKWAELIDNVVFSVVNVTTAAEACAFLERFYSAISSARSEASSVSSLVQRVLYYIKMNAVEGLRLEEVAEKFFVSPNYLSSMIKKETGTNYQQHVLAAKMNVARQMLDDTRMRIEEIAHAVGYENYVSFYNMFKRFEGKTPTEYRLRSRV